MSKRNILNNAVWCATEFIALPAVTALSIVTNEHDIVRSMTADIHSRMGNILTELESKKECAEEDCDGEEGEESN